MGDLSAAGSEAVMARRMEPLGQVVFSLMLMAAAGAAQAGPGWHGERVAVSLTLHHPLTATAYQAMVSEGSHTARLCLRNLAQRPFSLRISTNARSFIDQEARPGEYQSAHQQGCAGQSIELREFDRRESADIVHLLIAPE
jgi:hypothetical protein